VLVARRGYSINDWVELLPGGAALLTEDNVLVVADLHLGCEAALEDEGLSLPRVQTKKLARYMEDLISEFNPSKVIVAGDLKHNFSRNLNQEWRDVDKFVQLLKGLVPLEVVKGNHDNYLGQILRRHGTRLHILETRQGRVRIVHGHKGSRTNEPTVMGHIHPSIRLMDDVGASLKDQCFLFDPKRDILILPATSIVAPGLDIVSQLDSDTASPIVSDIGLSSFIPVIFSRDKALKFPTVGELRQVS
jgi:putative SbcD/Mre11-related phosphoesterase